ncbi:MASE1 domain-containing protein [Qipengyuania sp. YG27]|uniref:MASE1 domain-containing protein n=1 Tax=Qipengyuania mesophila TaxID=2867246 RepID=A0ABS7JWZ5_9SPHN|nr:MASE1 domain-containing protein [Qipengyuania mesophila]MBX7502185.1 MASE1 domain-containing protein [Qipengyuania mesophila]
MSFLRRREIAFILAVTALFGGLAYLGISVSRENGRVALLWMPNAIAAAWLLRARWASSGPLIASCALMNIAVNRFVGDSWLIAIGLSGANALEIALVVWIIRKQVQRRLDMSEISDQVWLLVASLIACFGSATMASFVLAGGEGAFAIRDWTKWALADGLSLLVLLPVLLVGADIWGARKSFTRKFVTEWLVMIAVVATGSTIVFAQSSYPFLFLVTSLIIYAAFRTGLAGTAAALLIVTIVASIASAAGRGPISLVRGGIEAQFFAFQVFLAANLVMGLPVAAMLAGRARDRLELKKSRDASQHILDNIRDVIFSTDKGGRWSSLNPAWETITGYCSEQSLGTIRTA